MGSVEKSTLLIFCIIGNCSNEVRSRGEFVLQILLESSLPSDEFLWKSGRWYYIISVEKTGKADLQ